VHGCSSKARRDLVSRCNLCWWSRPRDYSPMPDATGGFKWQCGCSANPSFL